MFDFDSADEDDEDIFSQLGISRQPVSGTRQVLGRKHGCESVRQFKKLCQTNQPTALHADSLGNFTSNKYNMIII